MKVLHYLLSLLRGSRPAAVHDDNLRAGTDAKANLVQLHAWNSLLL